ncbi:hypothetical protein Tco_1430086 [Tanacetum coccineum]
MIEGNGPKWLFDIDSLTQSMNYVPVTAGTISNDSAGTSEEISQDCIVMPIWKDTSYFDSPTKDVDNGEPKTADDAQKQVEDGPNNENAKQDKFADDSSTKDVNVVGQHVNIASPDVNIGSLKLNGNITNSYTVPTTLNTRIHKDRPIDNVIGDVKSSIQIRRMTKPTSEQGFLSLIGSLNVSTSSRIDIIYLNGKPTLGLWYSKDSPFELVAYTDSDYAGATQDRKSTTGGYLLTKGFDAGRFQYLVSIDKKRVIVTESSIRRNLYLDDAEGTDCLPTATIFEELAWRDGKDFSGRITPLFDTMMVQASEEIERSPNVGKEENKQNLQRLKRLKKLSRRVESSEDQESLVTTDSVEGSAASYKTMRNSLWLRHITDKQLSLKVSYYAATTKHYKTQGRGCSYRAKKDQIALVEQIARDYQSLVDAKLIEEPKASKDNKKKKQT